MGHQPPAPPVDLPEADDVDLGAQFPVSDDPGSRTGGPPASAPHDGVSGVALEITPRTPHHERRALRLLGRFTRAQNAIAAAGALVILLAFVVSGPTMPWPLREFQQLLRSAMSIDPGDVLRVGVYPLALGLQWVLVITGAVIVWLTMSWRLGRFPVLPLLGFLGAAVACLFLFSASATMTLLGWIAIAALASTYLHFYGKGRFGFTRGATAAVFSHIAMVCFYAGFSLVLVALLSAGVNAPMRQPTPPRRDTALAPEADLPYYRGEGVVFGLDPGWRIVKDGVVEVITDATAPSDLRALFEAQYGNVLPFSTTPQRWEVRIRCASVPDLPDVNPTLATGWFVTSANDGRSTVDQLRDVASRYTARGDVVRAERAEDTANMLAAAGLASTDDYVLEITERTDCDPPPLPPGAVTPEAVIAAAEQARLDITNPRDESDMCHEVQCVRRVMADEIMITVWPDAHTAQEKAEGIAADVLFAPVTTARVITGDVPGGYNDYEVGLEGAAAWVARQPRASNASGSRHR